MGTDEMPLPGCHLQQGPQDSHPRAHNSVGDRGRSGGENPGSHKAPHSTILHSHMTSTTTRVAPSVLSPASHGFVGTVTPTSSMGQRWHRGGPHTPTPAAEIPPGSSCCLSRCSLHLCSSGRICRLIKQILHLHRSSRAGGEAVGGHGAGGLVSYSFSPPPPLAS